MKFLRGDGFVLISIHAPTRGATSNPCVKCVHIPYFNPRSHERSDKKAIENSYTTGNFNPRSHERSDEVKAFYCEKLWDFNPRSHERSDGLVHRRLAFLRNFNPRSHERSDRVEKYSYTIPANFNPRSHERSDGRHCCVRKKQKISIHAPTRGATRSSRQQTTPIRFQSTLPREERRVTLAACCFKVIISIHAPTRGATLLRNQHTQQKCISIHAPTRGATGEQSPLKCK